LCPTYDPEKAEQKLRTRDRRLADFEALPWWESVIGNQYLNGPAYESSTIAVPLLGWRWWIYGQVRIWSAAAYDTRPAARRALFDYLDAHNMLGEPLGPRPPFSLVAALQEIETVCRRWSEPFQWKSNDYYLMNFSTLLGHVACSIYTNPHYAPFWELFVTLPDVEQGSKKYPGPRQTCRTAVEAKVAALDIFRKEMTRLTYERAGMQPEPEPPPPNAALRQQIADDHVRAEAERLARADAAQMAFEARQRQAEFAAQQRADAEEYARRIAEVEAEADERRRKTAVEERIAAQVQALTDLQWHLQGLPNAAQSLQDAINQVCADEWLWPYHFHRVAATGNYTARFAIETACIRCTIYYHDKGWHVGIFAPGGKEKPWHDESYDSETAAITAARHVFRCKLSRWAKQILERMTCNA
jgi:hypothetical protein